MLQLRVALSLTVSLFLAFSSQAQQIQAAAGQPLTSDPQAIQLGAQALSAMGYVAGPTSTSIQATGTIHAPDQEDGTFELIVANPRTYRTTTTRESGTYVYLMNDGIGAVTVANNKTKHIAGAEILSARCPFIPFYSFLGEISRTDLALRTPRAGITNGNPTYILSMIASDLSNPALPIQSLNELEVDAKSFLPLKLRTELVHSENIEIVSHLEYSYSDYRKEGAFLLPHTITLTVDGTLAYTVILDSFQFNVAADLAVRL